MTYFISGSNHAGEIRGLAFTGNDVGIAVCEVNEEAILELEKFAGGPMKVFADSGAFGEVAFPGGVPTITKPITDAEWTKRLGLYERLARTLRHQLYVVAPDCVAHQAETLQRLWRYRERMLALHLLGANIIVPVQKGALTMTAFREEATRILGLPNLVWGIPMKKDATKVAELAEFAAGLHTTGARTRLHLLGLGPKSPAFPAAMAVVLCNSPGTALTCDSVRITAMVGRTNGPGGGPRALTLARDQVLAEGIAQGTTQVKHAALGRVFHREHLQELQEARRNGWYDAELESAPGVPLEAGCIDYGPGGPFGVDLEKAA